ncbi:hypothetical protein FQZ97_839780 [compost metagenome]
MARRNGMGFQFGELRGEVLLLHRGNILIAEEQDFVLQPQRPDFGNDVRIQGGIGQADIAELGADGGCAKLHLDRVLKNRRTNDRRCHGAGLRSTVLKSCCFYH